MSDLFNGWPEDGEPVCDLIDRLRKHREYRSSKVNHRCNYCGNVPANWHPLICTEAADEIESLQKFDKVWEQANRQKDARIAELEAENARQAKLIRELNEHYGGQADEIERLTAALVEIATYGEPADLDSDDGYAMADIADTALAAVEEKDDE